MKRLGLILTAFVFSAELFSQAFNLEKAVGSKNFKELTAKGEITVVHDDGTDDLVLLPESNYKENFSANKVIKQPKNFPFVFEGLFYFDKDELLKASNSDKKTIGVDDIAVVLRSVSKMEGMKYYSTTRKKDMILYKNAYTIKSEEDASKVADSNSGNCDGQILYALLDDSSFGKTRFKLEYHQDENTIYTVFTNLDTMGIGPFKAIYPGNIKIHILAADCGEGILLYLATDLDSVNFPGIKGQISDSIISRMNAIHTWFTKQF